jgi:hypothetical protein
MLPSDSTVLELKQQTGGQVSAILYCTSVGFVWPSTNTFVVPKSAILAL